MSIVELPTRGHTIPQLLNPEQAAEVLACSVGSLANMRSEERGPKYVRIGRAIRYSLSDLMEYIAANTVEPRQEVA